jgi:sorting nexin-1/2
MSNVSLDDDDDDIPTSKARVPPPVEPPSGDAAPRPMQPSVSIVEAAKPFFHITVGDPHKVGDLTSAHTEYQVYTKVNRMPR